MGSIISPAATEQHCPTRSFSRDHRTDEPAGVIRPSPGPHDKGGRVRCDAKRRPSRPAAFFQLRRRVVGCEATHDPRPSIEAVTCSPRSALAKFAVTSREVGLPRSEAVASLKVSRAPGRSSRKSGSVSRPSGSQVMVFAIGWKPASVLIVTETLPPSGDDASAEHHFAMTTSALFGVAAARQKVATIAAQNLMRRRSVPAPVPAPWSGRWSRAGSGKRPRGRRRR